MFVGAEPLDQQVRREVAADGDHQLAEAPQRHRRSDSGVDLLVRVVAFAQRVRAAVHDAAELVLDDERCRRVEPSRPRAWRNSSIITGTFIVLAA